jgi:hypothetical protein
LTVTAAEEPQNPSASLPVQVDPVLVLEGLLSCATAGEASIRTAIVAPHESERFTPLAPTIDMSCPPDASGRSRT